MERKEYVILWIVLAYRAIVTHIHICLCFVVMLNLPC